MIKIWEFKKLSEVPKEIVDRLAFLNINHGSTPVSDYYHIAEYDSKKDKVIIYGDLKNFHDFSTDTISEKRLLLISNCFIKDGIIVKNRYGDEEGRWS